MCTQPFRAIHQILLVLGLGGNAREAQILAKLGNEPRFILFKVIQDGLHRVGVIIRHFFGLGIKSKGLNFAGGLLVAV